MNRGLLFLIISITASAFVVWVDLILFVPPKLSNVGLVIAFFVTLIIWLGSFLAWLIYFIRLKRTNREIIYATVMPSIRQGLVISLTIAGLLFLQLVRVLTIWDGILIILVAGLFELAVNRSETAKP